MGEYDKAVALALRLIKKKGRPAAIRRFPDAPLPDPAMPWRPAQAAPADDPCFAVLLDFGSAGEQYMPGTEVQVGDRLALVPASGLSSPPELRDLLVFDTEKPWAIITVQTLSPAGVDVLHSLQVRR